MQRKHLAHGGFFRSFLRNESGASAIEFAIVAVPLFWLLMAVFEFGLLFMTQVQLESIVSDVSRNMAIGDKGTAPDRATYMKDLIAQRAKELIHGERVVVSSEVLGSDRATIYHPELCLTNPPSVNATCPVGVAFEDDNKNGVYDGSTVGQDFGGANSIVQINVVLPWQFFTPALGQFFPGKNVSQSGASNVGDYGGYAIRTSMVVRNEPFDN